MKYIGVTSIFFFVAAAMAGGEAVPGEYLIKYRSYVDSSLAHNKISAKASLKSNISAAGTYHVALKPGVTLQEISADPDVEYIEPNYIIHKNDDVPVGEPEQIFSEGDMQMMSSTAYYQNYAPVQLTQAWQIIKPFDNTQAQNRPIVAIVDTGLDGTHRVITGTNAMWTNTGEVNGNGVDDDGNGYVDDIHGWNFITNTNNFTDDNGHGSHVAGIILGAGLDILSGSLDPAKVQLMPLKFLDSTGSGTTANAINAIYYAVNNGAKVINCSWGGSAYSRSLQDAIQFAYNHSVLVVSAAGNNSLNNDSNSMYPANYDVPSNMAVAATTDADALAYFSDYGVSTVQIAAPGYQIYSLYKNNQFATLSGTSMATPFIAGVAALIIRERPSITAYQIKQVLMADSDTLGSLSGKVMNSARVNPYRAIQDVQNSGFVVSATQPSYVASYKAEGTTSSASSSSGKAGAGCGLVKAIGDNLPPGFGGIVAFFLLAPFAFAYFLRQRTPASRRKFDRYNLSSAITVRCGEQVIVGSMKTISMGGASFNAAAALEKGGKVTMMIENPDGGAPIEVEGNIVWSAQNQSYGVQFAEAQDGVMSTINSWCRTLMKAS